MTEKVLAKIITEHGKAKHDGNVYGLPDGVSATVFCSLGSEALSISGREFRFEEVLLVIDSSQTFAVAFEDVRAISFQRGRRQTGYGS